MTSKSILTTLLVSVRLISSSSCRRGAFTFGYSNGDTVDTITNPLGVCQTHQQKRDRSIKYECIDGKLASYQYTDNLCKIRNDSLTTTTAVGDSNNGATLTKLECENACNCDYIEIKHWSVLPNEKCGQAKDHKDDISIQIFSRSELNRCISFEEQNGQQYSMLFEMSCTPDSETGIFGTTKEFDNADCSGIPTSSDNWIVRSGDVHGFQDSPTDTYASCIQVTHCDQGITNVAEPTCDNDEVVWAILAIAAVVALALGLTGALVFSKPKKDVGTNQDTGMI